MAVIGAAETGAAPPGSLARNRRLDQWLQIGGDGRITLRVGKVELGQGIATALAQIAAEELDVDIGRIVMVPPDTAGSPDEGMTSGSQSIEQSGRAVRQVCAEARAILLTAAATRLGVEESTLQIADGVISSTASAESTSYWRLAVGDLFAVEVTGDVATKPAGDYRIVGRSEPRRDLPAKVSGRPSFIHDLVLPGQLHGRIVRPPSPAARLDSIDVSAVRAMGGVVSVVCEGNFVGVVAEREELAMAAEERLRGAARWREEETLPDEAALAEHLRSAPAETSVVEGGAGHLTPAPAARSVSATYSRPYIAHASIGTGCGVARWGDDGVEVWSSSQGIFSLRRAMAMALGLDEGRIVVHHADGAGAYGHNSADDAAFDAVLLARSVPGRPVRVQWSRSDELSWSPFGSAMAVHLSADLDDHGGVVRWHHELWSQGHTSRPGYGGTPGLLAASHLQPSQPVLAAMDPPPPRGGSVRNAPPLYAFPEWRVTGHRLLTMPIRCSALRSLGAHMNVFAAESFIDELAATANRDPVAYRLDHLRDDRARAVLEAVARRVGWAATAGRPDAGRPDVGRGIAVARYKSTGAYCAVVAEVEAGHEIAVRRLTIAVDVGQVVNPDGVVNQVEGGAIQSTSWTVKERVRFDRTRITSTSWETYPILRFSEVPAVDVEIISRPDEPSLGAGEVAQGPTAAAIGNAVFAALGVRVRDLPLTTERVVEAIERADEAPTRNGRTGAVAPRGHGVDRLADRRKR